MAVMVAKSLIQVNLCCLIQGYSKSVPNSHEFLLQIFLPYTYHHSHFLAATLDFTLFSP